MRKSKLLLTLGVVAVCLIATPAWANIFSFSYSGVQSNFSSSLFTLDKTDNTLGRVYTDSAPGALFLPDSWAGPEDFSLSLTISNVQADTADGVGWFTITDVHGDTIVGNIVGTWVKTASQIQFFGGDLSNVIYSGDGTFTGHSGTLTMVPGSGSVGGISIAPLITSQWFDQSWQTPVTTGSVDASVVPIPGAVLLGFLGLTASGLGLRRLS